jgi:hypothetical protein
VYALPILKKIDLYDCKKHKVTLDFLQNFYIKICIFFL